MVVLLDRSLYKTYISAPVDHPLSSFICRPSLVSWHCHTTIFSIMVSSGITYVYL